MNTIAYAHTQSNYGNVLSRPQSVAYTVPPIAYSHGIYPDSVLPSYTNGPYTTYDASRSSTSLIPVGRHLTGPSFENLRDFNYSSSQLVPSLAGSVPASFPRHRRHSNASFAVRPQVMDQFRFSGTHQIKFKRRGAFSAGVSLSEAQSHIRLSNNDHYTLYDLNADGRATILLTIRWSGYPPMSYEVPADSYDGRISLQTLARRVSRACVHYMQSNFVPIMWDRVELHHIEEIAHGVWQPMLRVR
ncbi:hypothetical protein APHAL10511_002062 [Amanita phalloides]|nr:hypothetical protein APHAL10511_002062 [Amanita phalloides]